MAGNDRQVVVAAGMQPGDVGAAQGSHPVWVAAKGAGAEAVAQGGFGGLEHIERGTEVKVKAKTGELLPGDGTHLFGESWIPGGSEGHQVRERCQPVEDLVVG